MFGPMRSEPVNLPSWGLRAGYESFSFIDSIFPPSFSYLGMEQGPCLIFFFGGAKEACAAKEGQTVNI